MTVKFPKGVVLAILQYIGAYLRSRP